MKTKHQDMVKILQYLNETFVPYSTITHGTKQAPYEPLLRLQFGGDQLTAERARNSQKAVVNGSTPFERTLYPC